MYFSSCRWHDTQKALSRSLAASPVKNNAMPATIPTRLAIATRVPRLVDPTIATLHAGLTDGDGHRLGEDHPTRITPGARARRGGRAHGDPAHRRGLLRSVEHHGSHRIGPWLLRRLQRPGHLAGGESLGREIGFLIPDDGGVDVLAERPATVDPLGLLFAGAVKDLRGTDNLPAVGLDDPRLASEIGIHERDADDLVAASRAHGDLDLLTRAQAGRHG